MGTLWLLFELGGDHSRKPSALKLCAQLDLSVILESLDDLVHLLVTNFLVGDLPASKEDVDLDLVSAFQKSDGVIDFEFKVMDVSFWPELDFFDLDDHLFFPGGCVLFLDMSSRIGRRKVSRQDLESSYLGLQSSHTEYTLSLMEIKISDESIN